MDKYNFIKKGGLRPSEEQLLDTKLFYRNAAEIYARYNEWKNEDKFYFIPLYMEMTYSCAGWAAEVAPDPVWLGSFVRNTLDHPDLYEVRCPKCGKALHPFRYVGSPLSGRMDLEATCECGWSGYQSTSGWRLRATPLRNQVASDKLRYGKFKLLHPKTICSIADLLEYLR